MRDNGFSPRVFFLLIIGYFFPLFSREGLTTLFFLMSEKFFPGEYFFRVKAVPLSLVGFETDSLPLGDGFFDCRQADFLFSGV